MKTLTTVTIAVCAAVMSVTMIFCPFLTVRDCLLSYPIFSSKFLFLIHQSTFGISVFGIFH